MKYGHSHCDLSTTLMLAKTMLGFFFNKKLHFGQEDGVVT